VGSKTTAAFFVQATVAFGVSFLGALGGIYFLPLDPWQRLRTSAKVIRINRKATGRATRRGAMEKLLAERGPL
jgi:hypothetical protein